MSREMKKDGIMQPVSLFFEVGNIDRDKFVGTLEEKKLKGELGIPGELLVLVYKGSERKRGLDH